MSRTRRLVVAFGALALVAGINYLSGWGRPSVSAQARTGVELQTSRDPASSEAAGGLQRATLAAGCFWCTESDFDSIPGVVSTTSGYTGGDFANPTHEQVSAGGTGHVEAVEIVFDPKVVTFEQLLDYYWHNVDPFNAHGQFCDYGEQYRPVIFVHGTTQRRIAEASRTQLQARFSQPIVVELLDATAFYPAESYHQNYGSANPIRYCVYRWGCGRSARLAAIWQQAR